MNAAVLKQTTAVIAPDPFSAKRHMISVPAGLTIQQVVAQAIANDNLPPAWSSLYFRVYVGGEEIPSAWWARTRLKPDSHVAIVTAPRGGGGGGKVFRSLLTVAVIAMTAWIGGGGLFAIGLLGSTFGAGTVGAALMAAGVSLIGGVLVNALAPQPGAGAATSSQAYSLQGAQNAAKPNQPYVAVLGQRRVVPPLAAATWTETVGDDVYLRMLLAWHIGPCALSDIKIGETPIGAYDGVSMQHRLLPGDPFPTLYPNIVREQPLQLALTHAVGWVQQTTQRKTTTISIDFGWPTGQLKSGNNGNESTTVQLRVQYRQTGDTDWMDAPVGAGGTLTYAENKDAPFRRNIVWVVNEGQYDVRIMRLTADSTSTSVVDSVYWVALRSLADGLPVRNPDLAITALRIKSSAQLNGVLDNVNAVVQMYAPLWDAETGTFTGLGPTRNPGEIANWLALGPANARPLTGRVDVAQLGAWTERCAEKGWHCDHIIDNGGTLEQALQIVAGAGRGFGAMWFDGNLAVAVDDEQPAAVQIFSARNVKNFTGTISFPGELHAVNVTFADETNGYQTSTRTVFAAGYSDANATLIDTIDATGKTNPDEAWVVGWRYLAGRTLRPEVYEFDTNMQGLCVRIGQRADIAHYRMSVGISGARIRARVLNGDGQVTGFLLDETVTMQDGGDYVLRVQSGSAISLLNIVTVAGQTNSVTLQTPLEAEDAPAAGDHCIFGKAGLETLAAIVIGIATKGGKDGHITAIPYAPDLLADGGAIPAWDPQITPRVMHGPIVGVHVPGADKVINDNVIQAVNQVRGERAAGDAALQELYDGVAGDLAQVQDGIVTLSNARESSDAALRGVQNSVARAATALLQIQMVIPQLRQDYERQLYAYVQGLTGSDVTDFAARLFDVEGAVIDLKAGKADASRLGALDAQINTPTTGVAALISQLQETVALLDPASSSATILETAAAVRGQGIELAGQGVTLLQILNQLNNVRQAANLSLAYYQREITTTVQQGLNANAEAIGAVGVRMASAEANVTTVSKALTDGLTAQAQLTTTLYAALAGLTGNGAVQAAIDSEASARASGDAANADAILAATASLGDLSDTVNGVTASGYFGIHTAAAPGDAQARIQFLVAATAGGTFKQAALFIDAMSDGTSRIIMIADKTYIAFGSDKASLADAFQFSADGLYVKSAVIPNITADKITTGTLDVVTLVANGTLLTNMLADGAVSQVLFYSVGDHGAVDQTTGSAAIATDTLSGYAGYKAVFLFVGSLGREGGHDPSLAPQFFKENSAGSSSTAVGVPFPVGGSNAPALIGCSAFAVDTIGLTQPYYRVRVTVSDSSHYRCWAGGIVVIILKK